MAGKKKLIKVTQVKSPIGRKDYQEKKHPSKTTNTYYLPSSTTNYIVHHDYYSLSYYI